MKYALFVQYDGTEYGGWQVQKNTVTVQQKMEEAALDLFGKHVSVVASGRTDSGVHASAQVCHMEVETGVPAQKLADAFNFRLPEDIRVLKSASAPENFDATRSAKKKTYCYRMYFSQRQRPLKDRYSVWVKGYADLQKMQHISRFFEGEHDFKAYSKSGSSAKTTVRTVYSVEVKAFSEDGVTDIEVHVTGNGFLYNMVRTIVGTMLYFAQGSLDEAAVLKSLNKGDRSSVGKTMPANGLTLENVDYGFDLFGEE